MKEQDIRKRDVLNKYLELVRLDSQRIFSDRSKYSTINCPACGGGHSLLQFDKYDFSYVQCGNCDTLFVNPRPAYSDLVKFYADSPSTKYWIKEFFLPMANARQEMIFKPRALYVSEQFPDVQCKKVADVGAGFGLFLEELKKVWPDTDMFAIEPSSDMAYICRGKNINVIQSMLEDIDPSLYKFDLVTAFELFEHLLEPAIFLQKVYKLLQPGGALLLTTLNGLGFDVQVLWESSKSVSPPHHLNFMNPRSITILLEKIGFREIEVTTPGELDWDIVENCFIAEGIDPGRFFKTVSKYGTADSKSDLQSWIKKYNFSSHMRVLARKQGYEKR